MFYLHCIFLSSRIYFSRACFQIPGCIPSFMVFSRIYFTESRALLWMCLQSCTPPHPHPPPPPHPPRAQDLPNLNASSVPLASSNYDFLFTCKLQYLEKINYMRETKIETKSDKAVQLPCISYKQIPCQHSGLYHSKKLQWLLLHQTRREFVSHLVISLKRETLV